MSTTIKRHKCPVCENVQETSTNHFGKIWSECDECGNSPLICMEEDAIKFRENNEVETITTTLHFYDYDISNKKDYGLYEHLKKQLKMAGLTVFDTIVVDYRKQKKWYDRIKKLDGCEVHLETSYLFKNQWNTAGGLRLMDWAESIYNNKDLKRGYFLDQTEEMRAIRKSYDRCLYCGNLVEAGTPCTNKEGCSDYKTEKLI